MDTRTHLPSFDELPVPVPVPAPVPATSMTSTGTLHERDPIALRRYIAASPPVSSVMVKNLWTVHAEDTIQNVEKTMHREGLSSVPVMGSNGVIIGVVGARELAEFIAGNKNPHVVCAWEVSRCTNFEVAPETTIAQVASLMTHDRVEYIAVTENGVLLGAVSALDILRANEAMLDASYEAALLDNP